MTDIFHVGCSETFFSCKSDLEDPSAQLQGDKKFVFFCRVGSKPTIFSNLVDQRV